MGTVSRSSTLPARTLVCHLSVVDVSKGQTVRRGSTSACQAYWIGDGTSPAFLGADAHVTGRKVVFDESDGMDRGGGFFGASATAVFRGRRAFVLRVLVVMVRGSSGRPLQTPPTRNADVDDSVLGWDLGRTEGSWGSTGGDVPSGSYELWINGVFRGMVEKPAQDDLSSLVDRAPLSHRRELRGQIEVLRPLIRDLRSSEWGTSWPSVWP